MGTLKSKKVCSSKDIVKRTKNKQQIGIKYLQKTKSLSRIYSNAVIEEKTQLKK